MTTSRIVRGTKARIFLYICAVLIITGIIACYNNTLSQLEDARKSNEICHQQEEHLSTQLQVISDYKQRLEKSLKTEKAEHQQVKNDLENKLNEEKTKNEKGTNEANLRFNSLQQHFNMLQTQSEDLQTKLKEVQDELKEVKSSKESLKSKYVELQTKIDNLQGENGELKKQVEQQVKDNGDGQNQINHLTKENHQLQREIEELKRKYSAYESIQPPNVSPEASSSPRNAPSFNKQVQIDSNEYKIKLEENAVAEAPQAESQKQVIPPNQNFIKTPSRSTTTSNLKVSQGSLNGARPLLIPTITPKSAKVVPVPPLPYLNKLPEGVVPVPAKRDVEKKTDEEKNELPDETINNRYRNKISDIELKEEKKVDEADKDNGAHEVFDQHNVYDNFGFGDLNDPVKNAEKQNFNKQHIDQLGIDANKAYENDDNQQIEENEPEDDDPEYADRLGHIKDAVVRN